MLDSVRAMMADGTAACPSRAEIVASYAARERAWRAGDATTAHMLSVVLTTMMTCRSAHAARRRLRRKAAGGNLADPARTPAADA